MWDTSGSEAYQSMQSVFYRGSDACVLVCDLTDPKSFTNMENWKKEFVDKSGVKNPAKFPFFVLGNKVDLVDRRKVEYMRVSKWCKDGGLAGYFETSAKTAAGVAEAFQAVAKHAVSMQEGKL